MIVKGVKDKSYQDESALGDIGIAPVIVAAAAQYGPKAVAAGVNALRSLVGLFSKKKQAPPPPPPGLWARLKALLGLK